MKGKKTSEQIKQNIAETALELASSYKVPISEVPVNRIANQSGVSWSTVKNIMSEEEFEKFVSIKRKELAVDYSRILDRQIDSIYEDFENGRFDQANPISKYTSFGIVSDKWLQLVGKNDTRVTFTQNIVDVGQAIIDVINRGETDIKYANASKVAREVGLSERTSRHLIRNDEEVAEIAEYRLKELTFTIQDLRVRLSDILRDKISDPEEIDKFSIAQALKAYAILVDKEIILLNSGYIRSNKNQLPQVNVHFIG